jgi:O-succinylhomoserine sulfhydrylase
LLKAGDHVVLLAVHVWLDHQAHWLGVRHALACESTMVPQTDLAAWKAAIQPNTQLLFAETPTNPLTEVCDIAALADLAHNAGALLVRGQLLCHAHPAKARWPWAADIVMHSGTKYLDGQGRVMAGCAVWPVRRLVLSKCFARDEKRGMVLGTL